MNNIHCLIQLIVCLEFVLQYWQWAVTINKQVTNINQTLIISSMLKLTEIDICRFTAYCFLIKRTVRGNSAICVVSLINPTKHWSITTNIIMMTYIDLDIWPWKSIGHMASHRPVLLLSREVQANTIPYHILPQT